MSNGNSNSDGCPPMSAPSSNGPPRSDGRGGEYRRRHYVYSSDAIAAAEAAASFITSGNPMGFRNRSGSNSSGSHTANGSGQVSARSGNGNGPNGGSFLLRMQRQREALMQRQRREKAFLSKITAWAVAFVLGVVFLSIISGGQRKQHESTTKIESGHNAEIRTEKAEVLLLPSKNNGRIHGKGEESKRVNGRYVRVGKRNKNVLKEEKPKTISDVDGNIALEKETGLDRAIPSVLIFTYRTNLINTPESELADDEDVALSKNVRSIISLHPGASVRFLNDDDCLRSIRAVLGRDTNLTTHFVEEVRGMYKADICRGAALHETGGMYFDVDIEARMPLWDAISPDTKFVTTLVHKDSNHHGGFFQAFIGATRGHAILKRYLEIFVRYYEGKVKVDGPLGVYFLRMAYNEIVGEDGDDSTMDLWQEVRYHPDLFPDVKRKWGKRRACQMLVVAPPRKSKDFERKQLVPLFSHANGSRMCGGKDTDKNGNEKS